MKPCECRSVIDTKTMSEQGVGYNGIDIEVVPPNIIISTNNCELRLLQIVFERFAKWYLGIEDAKQNAVNFKWED